MNDPITPFRGIYPMLYACFGRDDGLDRALMRAQVRAAVAGGTHGVAVLGLATEVGKLSAQERRLLVESDTFDWQVRVYQAMQAGRQAEAEAIYREVLPAIIFGMQSLDALVCYGKRIALLRMGLGESVYDRAPALAPSAFGLECARRYASALGPLPGDAG